MTSISVAVSDPLQPLKGKTAIVTGSSSSIGAVIAQELSSRGANIVLNYPFLNLKEECDKVGKSLNTSWIAVCADLSTYEGPVALVAAAVEAFEYIDILVHNAARIPVEHLWSADPKSFSWAMDVNGRGTFLLTQATLPHLPPYQPSDPPAISGPSNSSRIICIGSGASRQPIPEQTVYAGTKGAIESMARVWAKELPPKYGCTVNCVVPGPVWNESMVRSAGERYEKMKDYFAENTPVQGSFAGMEDIAWTVAWLADPRSKWINGQAILVTGGLAMS